MNPVLVFQDEKARDHWMVERIFKRASLDLSTFDKLIADSTVLEKLNTGKWDKAILFGEDVVYTVLAARDIQRWAFRAVPLELNDKSLVVFPCFDPQRLLARKEEVKEGEKKKKGMRHPPRYQGKVVELLRKACTHDGKYKQMHTSYLLDPSPMEFGRWVDDFMGRADARTTCLSWDIETPYKMDEDDEEEYDEKERRIEKIFHRISFAWEEGKAVSIPHLPEYGPHIKRLLAWEGFHVGHNSNAFDIPIVESCGYPVGGIMLDNMDAFHMWEADLNKGLESVSALCTDMLPWKHLADGQPALYSCIDSDAALRSILFVKDKLAERGLWDRFLKEMEIIKILNEAGKRGNKVDNEFRLEMKAELEAALLEKIKESQNLVGKEFFRHKLYKRLPKGELEWEWVQTQGVQTIKVCSECGKKASTKHKCTSGKAWRKVEIESPCTFWHQEPDFTKIDSLEELQTRIKTEGFNPCSADQMKKYMRYHNHPVGTNHKTKQDSADVRHLWSLVRKYGEKFPLYRHTIEIRKIQKALGTYVNGLAPDENGLMHTTYVNSPQSWRLGSRDRNVQNLGKSNENPYAKRARRIIIPSTDRYLIGADSSAIEAVFVGKFMESDYYINEARKGIHAGLCCKWLKWEVTDANRRRVKEEQKDLYDRLKKMNHATNFGMGPYLAYMTYPEYFPTLGDAKKMQNFIFQEMPELPKWHHSLRVSAQKNGYLDNPWGMRFYFYDVFTYHHDEDGELIFDDNGLPKIKLGKDGKRVIAIKPQSSAAFFMRDNTHIIGHTEARDWMPAVYSIHDGYTLDVPYARVDTAINILGETLTRPIAEMDGLRVGCEIEIFEKNFLDSKKIKEIKIEV